MQAQTVLTLLADANLKNLIHFLCDDTIPLRSNFKFRKKDFFSRRFRSCKSLFTKG